MGDNRAFSRARSRPRDGPAARERQARPRNARARSHGPAIRPVVRSRLEGVRVPLGNQPRPAHAVPLSGLASGRTGRGGKHVVMRGRGHGMHQQRTPAGVLGGLWQVVRGHCVELSCCSVDESSCSRHCILKRDISGEVGKRKFLLRKDSIGCHQRVGSGICHEAKSRNVRFYYTYFETGLLKSITYVVFVAAGFF